jgi:hypothetical protein
LTPLRITRLRNAFSKKAENYAHMMAIYFMHCNLSLTDMVLVIEEWKPHQNWPKRLRDYIAHLGRKSETQPRSQAQTGQRMLPKDLRHLIGESLLLLFYAVVDIFEIWPWSHFWAISSAVLVIWLFIFMHFWNKAGMMFGCIFAAVGIFILYQSLSSRAASMARMASGGQ